MPWSDSNRWQRCLDSPRARSSFKLTTWVATIAEAKKLISAGQLALPVVMNRELGRESRVFFKVLLVPVGTASDKPKSVKQA
jgi:hypothetical protein